MHTKLFFALVSITLMYSGKYAFSGSFQHQDVHNFLQPDTLKPDTGLVKNDSTTAKISKNAIDAKVEYNAKDSMRFDVKNQLIFLYGDAEVNYKEINLKAAYIELNTGENTVSAYGVADSSGKMMGDPVFSENGKTYNTKKILYNFETKKGRITEVTTQEDEGYIHGETVKKDSNDVFYVKDGYYTTCNDTHPHFHIAAHKLKVIPDDKIITGPANLVIADIPTPLMLPFGIFPNRRGQASGILPIKYGDESKFGYFLEGGYYLGLGEHLDLTLRGQVYTQGSWGISTVSNYVKRYKFNGGFRLDYNKRILGEKEFPDYSTSQSFNIRWDHKQDAKAKPGRTFSASVNVASSNFNKQNAIHDYSNAFNNQLSSKINYHKDFAGTPFHFDASAEHSQSVVQRTVDLVLPNLVLNTDRITPFARTSQVGNIRWYEKIYFSYSANAKNTIHSADSTLFKNDSINTISKKMKNGVNHSIPVGTSIKLLKYFSLNPSISYNERWYLQTIEKRWNSDSLRVKTDTIQGFRAGRDLSFSTNLNTTLYGMYQFKRGKLIAIRHKMTPSVRFSYRPDYGQEKFGYYKEVQTDTTGRISRYSIFEQGMFGGPGSGRSNVIGFDLGNNLEMKIKTPKDTASETKKISLLDQLNFSTSYNITADSLKWAPVTVNASTRLFNIFNIRFQSTFDIYSVNLNGARINTLVFDRNKNLARLTNSDLDFGFSFQSKNGKKKEQIKPQSKPQELSNTKTSPDFNVPWSINFSYSLGYNKRTPKQLLAGQKEFIHSLHMDGDFNLTPKWKINLRTDYDFEEDKLTATSVGIHRDLHCWEMSVNWIPFGFARGYFFTLNVKAGVLRDLKVDHKFYPERELD